MVEFIVIVEARADAELGTKLAERVFLETVEWLDSDQLPYYFQWRGLKEGTEFSCWKDIKVINAKSVLYKLTRNDYSREQQCWEATDLEVLRERGENTGLASYLCEIETWLIPILSGVIQ
jgi:hypothetical protein